MYKIGPNPTVVEKLEIKATFNSNRAGVRVDVRVQRALATYMYILVKLESLSCTQIDKLNVIRVRRVRTFWFPPIPMMTRLLMIQ